jgi:hypothetical protein
LIAVPTRTTAARGKSDRINCNILQSLDFLYPVRLRVRHCPEGVLPDQVGNLMLEATDRLGQPLRAAIIYRRTHDLIALHDLASTNAIAIPVGRELLMRLGPYAVEHRYIGAQAPEIHLDNAAAAVDTLVDWAGASLEASRPGGSQPICPDDPKAGQNDGD